jgi:hypothetical protein
MINSRRIRQAGNAACVGKMRNVCIILVGKLQDPDINGRITLKWILRKQGGGYKLDMDK